MCGLVGIFNRNGQPVPVAVLRRMTDAVAHRGPDGEGFFTDSFIGLGHRRLAILDLSPLGHQPMSTPDGRYTLVFNGEIYNFNDLHAELQALGHKIVSQSDTEVLLCALAEWGTKALDKLNGMFAFALWDRRECTLLLARDRFGVKPLYYCQNGSSIAFGSEIKALLQAPGVRAEMDCEGLAEYLSFQNFFTDKTLFKGIQSLPHGCFLLIRAGNSAEVKPQRYWDYSFAEPKNRLSANEYREEVERLFRQAVSRQLISDVPVNCYLSGGMDTGSIAAVAASQLDNLKTFTIGFDLNSASGLELAFDERASAEYMSYVLQTEHYEMVLKAGDMERSMRKLVYHLEEPRVGQSYPNYYAAQLASKFGKVCLSGTGGDELFAGYPWRYYRAVVNDDFDHYIDKYYSFWQRMVPADAMPNILAPIASQVQGVRPLDIFRSVFPDQSETLTTPEDYINHSLYFEARTFLPGLLSVDDKLSMAHGLETRVPFLDNDLVDFAMRIPTDMKLGNLGEVVRLNENEPGHKTSRYYEKTHDGKLVLRQAMANIVPERVVKGVKQGFSGPDGSWFKGESIDFVRRTLYNDRAHLWDYLDRKTVLSLVDDHLSGRENRRLLIWSFLYLENWCSVFLGGSQSAEKAGAEFREAV